MSKYIKLFDNHSLYETFVNSLEFLLPNVSVCVLENEAHFNPLNILKFSVTYTVTDDSDLTKLYYYYAEEGEEEYWTTAAKYFAYIIIDGNSVSILDLDAALGMYQLSSGTHIVLYAFKDGNLTTFPSIFYECPDLTDITFPDTITTIDDSAFNNCGLINITLPKNLTTIGTDTFKDCKIVDIIIPENVTSIGSGAFYCTNTRLTCVIKAINPPTISSIPFKYILNSGTGSGVVAVYVPDESVLTYRNTSVWSSIETIIKPMSEYYPSNS